MNIKKISSILLLSLTLVSCSTNNEVNIDILKNYAIPAISSIPVIFKVDLPNVNNITYDVLSTIGHIDSKKQNEVKIFNENDEIHWSAYDYEIKDENNLYYRYGFIEGLIKKDQETKGYFLLGIRNHEEDLSSGYYEYKVEVISTLYDESLSLEEINTRLSNDKSSYSSSII